MDEENLKEEQGIIPCHKLPAVKEQVQSNHLLGHYIACYHQKYGVEPIFPADNSQHTAIRDIQRTLGDKAFKLIEHFFKMDPDGWYSKYRHSLETLKRNLNAVNTDLAKKTVSHGGGAIRIRTLFSCDGCFKHFWFECNPSIFSSGVKILCSKCSEIE